MRPLEDRFPRPALASLRPKGIIVLGGAMDQRISEARNALVLGIGGSRMTEGVALSRRFPDVQLIFTGGNGALLRGDVGEAATAKRFFEALGVADERIVIEDRSRNTEENAIFTRRIVQPQPGEKFILVTSGFHMPRAMGAFRRQGFDVAAWPADYTTSGGRSDFLQFHADAAGTLAKLDIAVREWIGLVAYGMSDKTDAIFPSP
jgi:uncharacterized SAM-binding protein YcdF (DUF218 family)